MNYGVIYVLTNPSFPEYVKIGYADNLEKRLKQLNRSECLPFAFRAYCVYEVSEKLKDKDVHNLIDTINPTLRAVETFDGKPRVREFYNISAQDAYEILASIASISGTQKRLKLVQPEGHEALDEQIAEEMQNTPCIEYSEENHLIKATADTKRIYEMIRSKLLSLDNLTIEPKKLYVAFKYKTNICDVEIQKMKLKITINLLKGELKDDLDMAIDVSKKGHWGNGDYIVHLQDEKNVEYTFSLIKQAYEKQYINE